MMRIEVQGDIRGIFNTYSILMKKGWRFIKQGDIYRGIFQWIHIFIYWEFPINEGLPGLYICILQLLNVYIHW